MRLIMMGTGPFAAPMFEALFLTKHEICALVTQPARSRHATQNPAREVALAHGLPTLDPDDVNAREVHPLLAAHEPDLFVVADFGQILSAETIAIARLGAVNLHASLLPKYRGAAPVQWAIYHGEQETGITVFHITPRVDAGPCLAQQRVAIDPHETAAQLESRLALVGAEIMPPVIDGIEAGTATPLAQDAAQATRAPRIKKRDGQIDWDRTAAALVNHVRAFEPWPRTFTYWHRPTGEPVRLILRRVRAVPGPGEAAPPGTVVAASGNRLEVAAGEDSLALESVQPAGKRELDADEFLRGYSIAVGQILGPLA